MPTPEPANGNLPSKAASALRLGGILLLIALLFAATLYNEAFYKVFGEFWGNIFSSSTSTQSQSDGTLGQLLHRPRNIAAVASYGIVYVCICIALLFLLLPHPYQRKLVLISYGFTAVAFVLLLIGSKLAGPILAVLNDQLLHFVVSPVPVIILAPLLWWYSSTRNSEAPN